MNCPECGDIGSPKFSFVTPQEMRTEFRCDCGMFWTNKKQLDGGAQYSYALETNRLE